MVYFPFLKTLIKLIYKFYEKIRLSFNIINNINIGNK